jgi:hypothetical protein
MVLLLELALLGLGLLPSELWGGRAVLARSIWSRARGRLMRSSSAAGMTGRLMSVSSGEGGIKAWQTKPAEATWMMVTGAGARPAACC